MKNEIRKKDLPDDCDQVPQTVENSKSRQIKPTEQGDEWDDFNENTLSGNRWNNEEVRKSIPTT